MEHGVAASWDSNESADATPGEVGDTIQCRKGR